ncbi:MAG: hypothetical protein INH41_25520 [Myxococcaceae bacterium]|jgi:hypothetical protein|nr:hypothetical protein [Myxococcaceae bacterium]MCA3015760.1 hypothetical protein [Myxococcaceae bacterium]
MAKTQLIMNIAAALLATGALAVRPPPYKPQKPRCGSSNVCSPQFDDAVAMGKTRITIEHDTCGGNGGGGNGGGKGGGKKG